MTTILITGASGALARKLIYKFSQDSNFEVTAVSSNPDKIVVPIRNVKYVSIDKLLICRELKKDFDFIIHTAFPRKFEVEDMFKGSQIFEAVLLQAIATGTKNFINISSQSVYGNYRETPSSEYTQVNPQDIYALTKYHCESIGLALAERKINYTNIRLASLIGSEYPERVINKMINNAIKNNSITVMNDKDTFGYLHINDAVDGLYNFIKNSNPNEWKKIYNLGAISDYSENLEYIANIIKGLFASRGIEIKVTVNKQEKANKLCLQNSEWFYKEANWEPHITLKTAIEQIFKEIY